MTTGGQATSRTLPWIAMVAVLAGGVYQLRQQGRLWICSCDYVLLWTNEYWGSNTSQQLLDPASFTHLLHGFVFCGLLALVVPRVPVVWRLWMAISIEVLWEVLENSEFVIRRYREGTAAFGYHGDTIVNSAGDVLSCGLGFLLARRLGFRRALAVFVAIEAALALWIRDGLLLNVVMLIYPVDAISAWQAAGH
jgi:Protein of unknown function (DUF2585)